MDLAVLLALAVGGGVIGARPGIGVRSGNRGSPGNRGRSGNKGSPPGIEVRHRE